MKESIRRRGIDFRVVHLRITIAFPMIKRVTVVPHDNNDSAYAPLPSSGRHVHHLREPVLNLRRRRVGGAVAKLEDGKVVVIPGVQVERLFPTPPRSRCRATAPSSFRVVQGSPEPEGADASAAGSGELLLRRGDGLGVSASALTVLTVVVPAAMGFRFQGLTFGGGVAFAAASAAAASAAAFAAAAASAAARLTMGPFFASAFTAAARSAALIVPSAPFASRAASAWVFGRLGFLGFFKEASSGSRPCSTRSRFFLPSAPFGRPAFARNPPRLPLGASGSFRVFASADFGLFAGAASAAAAREARFFLVAAGLAFAGLAFPFAFTSFDVDAGFRSAADVRADEAFEPSAPRLAGAFRPNTRGDGAGRVSRAFGSASAVRRSPFAPASPRASSSSPEVLPDRSDRSESSDASPPPWPPSLSSSSPPSPGTDPPSCSNESESYAAGARSSTFACGGSETDSEPETSLSLSPEEESPLPEESSSSSSPDEDESSESFESSDASDAGTSETARKPRASRAGPRAAEAGVFAAGARRRAGVGFDALAAVLLTVLGSGFRADPRDLEPGASTSAPAPDPSQYALGGRRWRPKLLRPATNAAAGVAAGLPSPSPESSPL